MAGTDVNHCSGAVSIAQKRGLEVLNKISRVRAKGDWIWGPFGGRGNNKHFQASCFVPFSKQGCSFEYPKHPVPTSNRMPEPSHIGICNEADSAVQIASRKGISIGTADWEPWGSFRHGILWMWCCRNRPRLFHPLLRSSPILFPKTSRNKQFCWQNFLSHLV